MARSKLKNPHDLQFLKEHKNLHERIRREELRLAIPSTGDVPRRGITVPFSPGTIDTGTGGGGPYHIDLSESAPTFLTEDVEVQGTGNLRILSPGIWVGDFYSYYRLKSGTTGDSTRLQSYRIGARLLKGTEEVCASEVAPYPVAFDANAYVEGAVGGIVPSILFEKYDILSFQLIPSWKDFDLTKVTQVEGFLRLSLMTALSNG